MVASGATSVDTYTRLFQELLQRGHQVKPVETIEPALKAEDFGDAIDTFASLSKQSETKNYAAIETAVRNIFYNLLASISIDDAAFSEVWNLLDILSILSDMEYCEPGLVFWLVEELLDSQTIDGCRVVFDYLDSRREQLTMKHFGKKSLIILRACNELLRRLSRAEDTVFCGRVFIFLFQSFPLGDRSSVNLRGEYHTENVTTYENIEPKEELQEGDAMVVDSKESEDDPTEPKKEAGPVPAEKVAHSSTAESFSGPKTVKFDSTDGSSVDEIPDMDTLYSMFWALQDYFSQPTRLFEAESLESFKTGLKSTMTKFRQIQQEQLARGSTKPPIESKRGSKRKRNGQEEELASVFNPKYLTSRDLFDLEISDLSFRRHILVQALILVDFLLSLTPKAKKKTEQNLINSAKNRNQSVLYSYTLSDDNAEWASNTRSDIATYLQQGPEGKFYFRMVDTVLSRDKNWVYWKAENCQPIARDPVSAIDFAEAQKSAQKTCAPKRIRPAAMGALDLSFLTEDKGSDGIEKLKDPTRYSMPPIDGYKSSIAEDDFDIEMAKNGEEQREAKERRASKLWRTLRIASKSKLNAFEKIEDGKNLKPLFEPENEEPKEKAEINGVEKGSELLVKAEGLIGDETKQAVGDHEENQEENIAKEVT